VPVKQDYYQVLGLARDASANEIKTAYRKLAREYHPDVNRDNPEAEDRFKEINEAYEVLSDPEKRRRYDTFGHEGPSGPPGFGGGGTGRDAFDTLFDLFFEAAGGGRSGSQSRGGVDGQDLRADVQLTLEEVNAGVEKILDVVREEACETCEGTGAKPGSRSQTCARCHGSGQIRQTQSTFLGSFSSVRPCPQCHGEGTIISDPCGTCHGSGRQRKKSKVRVEIPAGVENGMQMRLAGNGDAGARGGQSGDLYVVIHVRPHERFERRGPDLACEWEIGFAQAALGTTVEIPTLGEPVPLKIPAGAQSHTRYTLRGHGLPRLQGGMGDLLVLVKVVTPTHLSEEQRQLYQLLSRIEGGEAADASSDEEEPQHAGIFSKIKEFLSG
jgi:molecular chaperone DnaJ